MDILRRNTSDLALLKRWKANRDGVAFHTLVGKYSGLVFGACRRVLGNDAEAEDVVQECFLTLATTETVIESSVGAWLHRLATHRSIDRLRSDSKRRTREQAYAEKQDRVTVPAWNELQEHIDTAIDALPEELRRILIAHFMEGKTQKAIARELGISRRVTAYRLQKAIGQIRENLRQRGVAPGTKNVDAFLASGVLTGLGKPMSASLASSLAKISISGLAPAREAATGAGATQSAITGILGTLLMKKALIVTIGILALVSGWYLWNRGEPAAPQPSESFKPDKLNESTPALEAEPDSTMPVAGKETGNGKAALEGLMQAVSRAESPPTPEQTGPIIHETEEVASILGWVRDDEEFPIPHASVRVVATGLDPGQDGMPVPSEYRKTFDRILRSAEHTYIAETDAEGAFAITGIRYLGTAILSAQADGYVKGNQVLLLTANGEAQATVHLTPGVPLDGQVLGASGQPVTDGMVQISGFAVRGSVWMGSAGIGSSASTDEKGEFRLWLKPWDDANALATFEVDSLLHGRVTLREIPVEPGGYVTLQYQPKASLHGTIRRSDGTPASDCSIRLSGLIVIRNNGSTGVQTGLEYTGDIGATGTYRIDGIDPEQVYSISIVLPSGDPVATGRDPGAFSTGEDKQWDYTIEDAAFVTGVVRGALDHAPLPGRIVRCQRIDPETFSSAITDVTTTDDKGAYTLHVLAGKGLYRIHADYGVEGVGASLGGPELEYAKQVELAPGKRETVDLELPDPWSCRFVLVDSAGAPIDGAMAHIQESSNGGTIGYTYPRRSTQDGKLEILGLTPNSKVTFRFESPGFLQSEPLTISGYSGEAFPEQAVILYRPSSIMATLVDESGAALANLPVVVNIYADGVQIATAKTSTDPGGAMAVRNEIPAVTGIIEIVTERDGSETQDAFTYMSPQTAFPAGLVVDFGTVVLDRT